VLELAENGLFLFRDEKNKLFVEKSFRLFIIIVLY
jgi:hypothetical protein